MQLKLVAGAACIAVASATSCFAATVTENFESFANGDIVTSLTGLTITATDGGSPTIATATSPVVAGEPQGLFNGPSFIPSLIFDFVGVGSAIGAIVDFGSVGTGLQIEAFDGAGGSGSLLSSASTITESFLGVSTAGIKSVVFSQAGGTQASWLLDNLTYTYDDTAVSPVPLPAGGLLLLGGFGLLAGLKRKKKRAA